MLLSAELLPVEHKSDEMAFKAHRLGHRDMTCQLHTEYQETCATCRGDMLSKEYYYHCTVNTFDILASGGSLKRRRTMGAEYISLWMTKGGLIPDSGRYYDAPDQRDDTRYGESVFPISCAFIWRASINPKYVPTYGAGAATNLQGTDAIARALGTNLAGQGLASSLPSGKAMTIPAKPVGPAHMPAAARSSSIASASAPSPLGGAQPNKPSLKVRQWPDVKGKGEHLCPVELTVKQPNFLGLRVPAKREADFVRLIGALYILGEKEVPVALGNMNFVEAGVEFSRVQNALEKIERPANRKYFMQGTTIRQGKELMSNVNRILSEGLASASSAGSISLAQIAR